MLAAKTRWKQIVDKYASVRIICFAIATDLQIRKQQFRFKSYNTHSDVSQLTFEDLPRHLCQVLAVSFTTLGVKSFRICEGKEKSGVTT